MLAYASCIHKDTYFFEHLILSPGKDWLDRQLGPGSQDPQHKTLFHRYSLQFLLAKAGFESVSIQAPMRLLKFLGPIQPQIGGQIFCVAKKK